MNILKSVYQYKNYRTYLIDYYDYKKKQSSNFSYKHFSQLAKIKSPNFLKFIMDGKRNLTIEKIHLFAKGLELSHSEKVYFETLVLYNQAEIKETKKYYKNRLDDLVQLYPVKKVNLSANDIISQWYYPALILYLHEKDVDQDLRPLANIIKITSKEIQQIIEKLLSKKLLIIENYKYQLTHGYIKTNENRYNMIQQNYLKAQLNRSLDAFKKKYRTGNQEFNTFFSHTFTFSKEEWKKYVELIKSFLETTTHYSNQDTPESIGQMNVQLFVVE